MIRASFRGPGQQHLSGIRRRIGQNLEAAALRATDRAAKMAGNEIRGAMRGAGLGKLASAIGDGSDLRKGGRVRRTGVGGFSASGNVHVRGKSDRTLGAIESYMGAGTTITPSRSKWLWIATRDIPARVGRYRMTPERYRKAGLEERLGALIEIPGRNAGERLLVIKRVSTLDRKGSARRLPKSGKLRGKREMREVLVAFVGIRSTSRQARVDPIKILSGVQGRLPALIVDAVKG